MARRQNFRKTEIAAFLAGTPVEILNGSHWVPGQILTGEVVIDGIGCKGMWVEYTGPTTRTITRGQDWMASPGAIRLPA